MSSKDAHRRKDRGSPSDDGWLLGLSLKAVGILAVVAIAVVVGLPTAVLFGLGDLLTHGPGGFIKTFLGALFMSAVLFLLSVAWELWKDRRNKRKGRATQPRGRG